MDNEKLREVWVERMESFAREGLTVKTWCAGHQIPEHQFYYWRHKLTESAAGKTKGAQWCALEIVPGAAGRCRTSGGVTIRLGQATIEVASGFDAKLLRAVVRALEVTPC